MARTTRARKGWKKTNLGFTSGQVLDDRFEVFRGGNGSWHCRDRWTDSYFGATSATMREAKLIAEATAAEVRRAASKAAG